MKTAVQQLQADRVEAVTAEVCRLFPEALGRWKELYPAFRLRKLEALRRLLAGEIQRGRR